MRLSSNPARQRGSISIELALATPILFLVLFGGMQLGTTLITRHRLEDAVSFAARRTSMSLDTSNQSVLALVRQRMANEQNQCAPLLVQTRIENAGPSAPANIVVEAACTLAQQLDVLPGLNEIRAVASIPLQRQEN
jgi:Flp pilus assembly protein TadG